MFGIAAPPPSGVSEQELNNALLIADLKSDRQRYYDEIQSLRGKLAEAERITANWRQIAEDAKADHRDAVANCSKWREGKLAVEKGLREAIAEYKEKIASLEQQVESYQKVGGAAGQVMQGYLNQIAALRAALKEALMLLSPHITTADFNRFHALTSHREGE